MLVAGGQAVSAGTYRLKDVSRTWFTHLTDPLRHDVQATVESLFAGLL